ncbi:MAG: hypothetical protein M1832_005200 [Thelocarpon impressellum]|nr:MAG: hypothetical protein M1832_005200 [Thelocarpon impressellum]
MLLFQHNNLKSTEWVGVRRELTQALRKVDQARAAEGREHTELADGIKLQTLQTGIFAAALRVVEFYRPESSATLLSTTASSEAPALTHALSRAAHDAVVNKKLSHALAPLLSGPLVVLSFPTVSPSHLAAALSILAPSPPQFAAPKRRVSPGYYDPAVQGGLQKLLLLGARVEGKVFDSEGTRWVGSIEGGLDGLRAQLVWMLQGVGSGLTNTLESAGQSLYLTMEGRKEMLEDGEKGPGETDGIDKEA